MMSEDKGHGYAGGWSESGFDASIPVWDGRADTLREFKKTVPWWLSSTDLSKTRFFNLAARFAMRQKGSAKLRALEFSPDELAYSPEESIDDPDKPDEKVVLKEADYTIGIWKLIDPWETMVGKTVNDKKGELREILYLSLKRSPQESIVAFSLRFRAQIAEMRAEGIQLNDEEAAWFYRQKLQLTEIQKQLLETALSSAGERYAEAKREAVRLFKRIHMTGPSLNPAPWKRPPLKPFSGKGFSSGRRPSSSGSTVVSAASGSSGFFQGLSHVIGCFSSQCC